MDIKKTKPNFKIMIYIIYSLLIISTIFFIYKKGFSSGEFISYSILIIILAIATVTDVKKMLIPNKLLIIGFLISLVFIFVNSNITILSKVLGGLISGGLVLGLLYLTKGGIGMGDVKMISMVGFYTGLVNIFNILIISTLFSGLAGILLLGFKIKGKKDSLPFAPFVLMGTVFVLLIN